jgi:hypothetical protein
VYFRSIKIFSSNLFHRLKSLSCLLNVHITRAQEKPQTKLLQTSHAGPITRKNLVFPLRRIQKKITKQNTDRIANGSISIPSHTHSVMYSKDKKDVNSTHVCDDEGPAQGRALFGAQGVRETHVVGRTAKAVVGVHERRRIGARAMR